MVSANFNQLIKGGFGLLFYGSNMIYLKKDGKTEIEINDRPETIAEAEKLGWKKKPAKRKTPAKKAADK